MVAFFANSQNDLSTSAARRRQGSGIGDNRKFGKLSLTFRQRFPDGDALGANSQSVTCTFNVTTGVDLALTPSSPRPQPGSLRTARPTAAAPSFAVSISCCKLSSLTIDLNRD